MTRTSRNLIIFTLVVLVFALAGCRSSEPLAADDGAGALDVSPVPTLLEVESAVSLDAAQAEAVDAALREWRNARTGPNRRGDRFDPERHHPQMEFVAEVAPLLDNEQLADLVEFLAERNRQRAPRAPRQGLGRGRGQRERMAEELELTAGQREALRAMRADGWQTGRQLHERFRNGEISEEELNEAIRALRNEHKEKLAEILSEEQLAKHEEIRETRMKRMIERRLERVGQRIDARVDYLSKVLRLDGDQPAQIRSILGEAENERRTVLESLRTGEITREQSHSRMREITESTGEELEKILNDEQIERLTAVRRLRPLGPRHW